MFRVEQAKEETGGGKGARREKRRRINRKILLAEHNWPVVNKIKKIKVKREKGKGKGKKEREKGKRKGKRAKGKENEREKGGMMERRQIPISDLNLPPHYILILVHVLQTRNAYGTRRKIIRCKKRRGERGGSEK
jgi:hypothetical protein